MAKIKKKKKFMWLYIQDLHDYVHVVLNKNVFFKVYFLIASIIIITTRLLQHKNRYIVNT